MWVYQGLFRTFSRFRSVLAIQLDMARRELEDGIVLDLKKDSTYGGYLCLDELLSAQKPRSSRPHDEMLFIIQHQTSELWMKQMLLELDLACELVRNDRLSESFKILARIGEIQQILFAQWGVLETMTPSDYLGFRDGLGASSGFQSYQYRALEFALGNKDQALLRAHEGTPEIHAWLSERLARPSLYDEYLRYLARRDHAIPESHINRDFREPYEASSAVQAVFKQIYEHPARYWNEYDMCEKLVDIEERFQLWRFRHMTTVKRIIGFRRGTGGSSGVGFLKQALELIFFPELWDVRTDLKMPQ
jgi:tryptophan 2,3-dioxygenase